MYRTGYKAYQKGFFGCLEAGDRYVCFTFSQGTLRPITTYAKENFECHDHFPATLHKFLPRHFFLHRRVAIASIGTRDLARAAQAPACSTGRDACPSPGGCGSVGE